MILVGNVLDKLRDIPDESVNCIVTSPPYWGLRQYLFDGAVVIKSDLTQKQRDYVDFELARLGIKPGDQS